jgi:Lysylphosphatidylglycerol synthase TM region
MRYSAGSPYLSTRERHSIEEALGSINHMHQDALSPLLPIRPSDAASGDRSLSKLAWIAKLLVSIALVWWLLHSFSFAPVIDRMGGIRAVELIAILALAAAPFLMFGVRWWLVGKGCAAELPLPAAVRIAFISMFFNQTLPTTVSADIVRSYLASREGVPVQRATSGWCSTGSSDPSRCSAWWSPPCPRSMRSCRTRRCVAA